MTSIELPDPLWRIEVRVSYGEAITADAYWAMLYFGDTEVYSQRYSATENDTVFWESDSRSNSEDYIKDKFTETCGYKIQQMFHSWGGPIR